MNISQVIQERVDKASQEVTSLYSYKEYVDTRIDEFSKIISGQYSGFFEITDSQKVLYDISSQEYMDCLNGVIDEVNLVKHGTSDRVLFTADSVCDAVEDLMSEARCQSEFLTMCISKFSSQVDSVDYVSMISSKFPNISSGQYSKFERILSSGLSGKDAIFCFISHMSNSEVSESYGFQIANYDGFADSVANITAMKIWEDVSEALLKVGDTIKSIIGFFKTLGSKILQFGSWVLGLAPVNLSRFEFGGCSDIGYLDFPVIQIPFYSLIGVADSLKSHFPNNYCGYPWNGKRYTLMYRDIDIDRMARNIMWTEYDTTYPSGTVDVVVSSKPFNMLIRLGTIIEANGVYNHALSVYPVISKDDVKNMSDEDVLDNIIFSVSDMLRNVSEVSPMVFRNQENADDVDAIWQAYTRLVIEKDTAHPNDLFFATNGRMINISSINTIMNDQSNIPNRCQIFLSLLTYVCLTTRGVIYDVDLHRHPLGWYLFPYASTEGIDDTLESVDPCNDYSINYSGNYSPYVKSNLLPIGCHYQAPNEQAEDIINFMKIIIVSGFAIVATIAVATALKNAKIRKQLAQADVDRLSWAVSENPTMDNLNAFLKARKKNNRLKFIGSLFGVASQSDDLGILLRSVLPALTSGDSLSSLRILIKGS